MKYAISSHHATLFGLGSFAYVLLRSGFESLKGKIPQLGYIDKQFNSLLLRVGRSDLNTKLVGPHLFDAVELHLTDPRMFYNPIEWKINEGMIKLVKAPVASFHCHVETNPLLHKYVFNLCDTSVKTRKAIGSQLEAAYKLMRAHPRMVVVKDPVFVFHAGVARSDAARASSLAGTRENVQYIAEENSRLYEKYGSRRKVVPTIENSPADDRLSLGQTIEEWGRTIAGLEKDVKLTLDYGHILTVPEQRKQLLQELERGRLGDSIVNLHLHYSPEVDEQVYHAHAPLSRIPRSGLDDFRRDLDMILDRTRIREHGYVTLEVPSKDPLDYIPSLRYLARGWSLVSRVIAPSGVFEFDAYRGNVDDQLDSLEMARQMIKA